MTELMWDGKYKNGKKVGPVRIALPFQPVETVNETAQQRQLTLDMLFAGRDPEWRNRLIWGDKKYVLPSLLPEFAGKVNLIYIDPPFATGADFSFTTTIPESDATFVKEPSMIEQKAYRDTWGQGLDGYLQWFYETSVMLRELLSEDGSIYVHCDWRVSGHIRLVLNDFEYEFARFLENAKDVHAFSKLPQQFGFSIEYTDNNANLRYYYPDFVVKNELGEMWLVETKGQESLEVAFKDRAAQLWCENATKLTGERWRYVKVPQKEYVKLQPVEFWDLAAFA